MTGNVVVMNMIPQIGEKDGRIWTAKKEKRHGKSALFCLHKASKNKIPVRQSADIRTGKGGL